MSSLDVDKELCVFSYMNFTPSDVNLPLSDGLLRMSDIKPIQNSTPHLQEKFQQRGKGMNRILCVLQDFAIPPV